jgi:hypothetical protein
VHTIEALEDFLELEVASREIGGSRQAVEIAGIEWSGAVRAPQRVIGITPGAALVTLTAVLELAHLGPCYPSSAAERI